MEIFSSCQYKKNKNPSYDYSTVLFTSCTSLATKLVTNTNKSQLGFDQKSANLSRGAAVAYQEIAPVRKLTAC